MYNVQSNDDAGVDKQSANNPKRPRLAVASISIMQRWPLDLGFIYASPPAVGVLPGFVAWGNKGMPPHPNPSIKSPSIGCLVTGQAPARGRVQQELDRMVRRLACCRDKRFTCSLLRAACDRVRLFQIQKSTAGVGYSVSAESQNVSS